MLALIEQSKEGYSARYERHWAFSVEEVWSWLTENEKLKQWFPELSVEELKEGGRILFNMGNGSFEKMTILELKINSVLEFTWDKDIVRFELYEKSDGCQLVFIEKIKNLTDHTPRDLAGWHVCLDVIHTLLEGRTIESRKKEWEKWYPKYVEAIKKVVQ